MARCSSSSRALHRQDAPFHLGKVHNRGTEAEPSFRQTAMTCYYLTLVTSSAPCCLSSFNMTVAFLTLDSHTWTEYFVFATCALMKSATERSYHDEEFLAHVEDEVIQVGGKADLVRARKSAVVRTWRSLSIGDSLSDLPSHQWPHRAWNEVIKATEQMEM